MTYGSSRSSYELALVKLVADAVVLFAFFFEVVRAGIYDFSFNACFWIAR